MNGWKKEIERSETNPGWKEEKEESKVYSFTWFSDDFYMISRKQLVQ